MAEFGSEGIVRELQTVTSAGRDALQVLRELNSLTGDTNLGGVGGGAGGLGSGGGGSFGGGGINTPERSISRGGIQQARGTFNFGRKIFKGAAAVNSLLAINDVVNSLVEDQEGMSEARKGLRQAATRVQAVEALATFGGPVARGAAFIGGTVARLGIGAVENSLDKADSKSKALDAIRKSRIGVRDEDTIGVFDSDTTTAIKSGINAFQRNYLPGSHTLTGDLFTLNSPVSMETSAGRYAALSKKYGSDEKIIEQIKKSIESAEEGYSKIAIGNVMGGSDNLKEANKIDPNLGKMWANPGAIYTQMESARISGRIYASTLMRRAGPRDGD